MTSLRSVMAGFADRIGEYRIERELGRSNGSVELDAYHLVLPRRAVIKVSAAQPVSMTVLREACILEALAHPGVVRVYEAGLTVDRRPYFAREVVHGTTIASTLAPGAIDRVDVVALLRDVADILAHAHGRGVVHGHLRPDRILMTGRTRLFPLCIIDWSDARAHDAQTAPPVPTVASWYYTAPEVAAGDAIDDRADVFSLGVIAYRLLTGVLPFEGPVAVASDGTTQHVPTEVRCPEAPRELTQLVDQMLAADHWDRPSSGEALEVLRWLSEVLAVPAATAKGQLRIRKPRWTPALDFGRSLGAEVIEDDDDVVLLEPDRD